MRCKKVLKTSDRFISINVKWDTEFTFVTIKNHNCL